MAQQPIELILFRQLATSLAVPVFLVDDQGDLVYLNEPAEELLGIRLDELDRMPFETWTEAFQPRTRDGIAEPAESLPLVRSLAVRRAARPGTPTRLDPRSELDVQPASLGGIGQQHL
jgi:PAS domain-containing protein